MPHTLRQPDNTTVCTYPRCRGRHCAGGEHRPVDDRELVKHAADLQTTEARLHTR